MRAEEITIRRAVCRDVGEIARVEEICFPAREAADFETFQRRFTAFGDCFFVAEAKEGIVGFIDGCVTDTPYLPDELYHDERLHCPDGAYQTVFGLAVIPKYRHNEIAVRLMKALIADAKRRNKKGIVLTCKDGLIPFYQKFGYEHRGISESTHGGVRWNDMLLEF